MLGGDRKRLELAYSLLFTLPDTPVIRYGDELGMGDNLDLPERNCARTPMQWSDEPHGGFTKSDKPFMPVISAGPYGLSTSTPRSNAGIPIHVLRRGMEQWNKAGLPVEGSTEAAAA